MDAEVHDLQAAPDEVLLDDLLEPEAIAVCADPDLHAETASMTEIL
jgi:hypothetical protein